MADKPTSYGHFNIEILEAFPEDTVDLRAVPARC
jgi:hypothetical protein